jgi:hypothetical protein
LIEVFTPAFECWNNWLAWDNEYAIAECKSMEAGAGKYMNLPAVVIHFILNNI